ncbi:MAG TPA: MFS transporter [Thermomicrobiales bacterium]|nr:MFS transporter [Thermomicrobiales bacterium]
MAAITSPTAIDPKAPAPAASDRPRALPAPTRSRLAGIILALGIMLVAVNLRTTIIALPPFMPTIRAETGLSAMATGLLTTMPIMCWATLSLFAPRVARRIGFDWSLIAMTGLLSAGILIRVIPAIWSLYAGTLVIGIALALGNVIAPASVKRDFPHKPGLMMSLYGVGMSVGGAISAAIVMPIHLRTGLSWRMTLGLLVIPALVTLAVLLPRLRMHSVLATNAAMRATEAVNSDRPRPRLWNDLLAWQISIFFGLQAAIFYGLGTWAPTIVTDQGVSQSTAASIFAVAQLGGIPASFIVPLLIQNGLPIRRLVLAIGSLFTIGIAGMLVMPAVSPVLTAAWLILMNVAGASAMACTLMLMVLRSPDTEHAAAISGMSQAVGYAIAGVSPFLFGMLHDLSGSWTLPTVVILCTVLPIVWAGLGASRERMLGHRPASGEHLVMAAPDAVAASPQPTAE